MKVEQYWLGNLQVKEQQNIVLFFLNLNISLYRFWQHFRMNCDNKIIPLCSLMDFMRNCLLVAHKNSQTATFPL